MDLKVNVHRCEVVQWVCADVHGLIELFIVEGCSVNSLANWKTNLELLVASNENNDATDGSLELFLFPSFFELLDGGIDHQSSLIFIMDTNEKVLEAEVTSEVFENALIGQGYFLLLQSGELLLGFFTKDNLGSCLAGLVSEVFPLLAFVVSDGGFDLLCDLHPIDEEILGSVPGK